MNGPDDQVPALRVLNTDATAEEVAALVAVFSALHAPAPGATAPQSQWAAPARKMTRVLPHGHGGWRASALPR